MTNNQNPSQTSSNQKWLTLGGLIGTAAFIIIVYMAIYSPSDGCKEIEFQGNLIKVDCNESIRPQIIGPDIGDVNDSISFSAGIHPNAVRYDWDFGDGKTGSGKSVVHKYDIDGSQNVILLVVDKDNNRYSVQKTITIVEKPEQFIPPQSVISAPREGKVGEKITFDGAKSIEGNAEIIKWQWDFDDGFKSDGKITEHSFDKSKLYTVTLIVTDANGETSEEKEHPIIIKEIIQPIKKPPLATMDCSVSDLTVTCDSSQSQDFDGNPVKQYDWNFGDGKTNTKYHPVTTVEHTYQTEGTKIITLIVYDDEHQSSIPVIQYVNVEMPDSDGDNISDFQDMCPNEQAYTHDGCPLPTPPVANIQCLPTSIQEGGSVTCNASDSYDDEEIIRYHWTFGDGTTSDSHTDIHTYNNAGTYIVTLIVTDNDGLTDTKTEIIEVKQREKFEGTWMNTNSDTKGITKFVISQDGQTVNVNAWGSCIPEDCNWGSVAGTTNNSGDKVVIVYNFSFKIATMTMTMTSTTEMYVDIVDAYIDDSGRDTQETREYFKKSFTLFKPLKIMPK